MQLSNRIRATRPLATTALHTRADELKARGEKVIDLAIAISDCPAPADVVEKTVAGVRAARLPYTAVGGGMDVRKTLVEKLRTENDIDAQINEVILTNGAKQAVYEALYTLTDPGDEVIIFRPYWPAFVTISELLGLRPILLDLPQRFTPEALAALPPAKVIIINNPHNPLGNVLAHDEVAAIADWMKKTDCSAIADESYERLIFEGRHVSLASLCDWRELGVVSIFSASQTYAMMGWRIGFAVASEAIVRAMENLQGPITAAPSAITQVAAAAAFSSGDPAALRANYLQRRDALMAMLTPVPWMKPVCPAAGPYLWVDISALTGDTMAFVEGLLEQERITVMPGEALGVAGCIRLNFISESVDVLRQAVDGIVRFGNGIAEGKHASRQ